MDALCIYKNDILELAAELLPSAGVSFSLHWYGNAEKGIGIDITRTDEHPIQYRWHPLRLLVGEKISFLTGKANTTEEPIERFTVEDLVSMARSKPKPKPGERARACRREIGDLDCEINNEYLFSFRLNTDNMLSVEFVWLGDRTGRSVMHVGPEVSPSPKIPEIGFGDEVTFRTIPYLAQKGAEKTGGKRGGKKWEKRLP